MEELFPQTLLFLDHFNHFQSPLNLIQHEISIDHCFFHPCDRRGTTDWEPSRETCKRLYLILRCSRLTPLSSWYIILLQSDGSGPNACITSYRSLV